MEREANYTAVGAFVILVAAMAGLFVYWYSEGRDRRSYVSYEIYFQGSVTGLSEGGSVRYLGVEVGKVRRIRLDSRSAERVQIVAEIDQSAPVSERTTAELSTLSLATGLLYIDLKQTSDDRVVLPAVPSERYPVIRTVRSNFDTFLASLPDLAGSAAALMERAQQIFSPENSAALSRMVKNLHDASANLPATMQRVDALVQSLDATSSDVRELAVSMQSVVVDVSPQIRQLSERMNRTASNLEQASAAMNGFIAENRSSVSGFMQDGLPQLQRTLTEAQAAVEAFGELSRSLKADPSQLIYQPARRGVEVPR
jgi:phospholipid/cholesterol/gamma-HCH transport system substrate-binding protein